MRSYIVLLLATFLCGKPPLFAADAGSASSALVSAQRKVNLIEQDRWPSNKAFPFTAAELVALGISELETSAPGAVNNPNLELTRDGATGTALIDFDRIRQLRPASGSSGEWLFSKFLTGQRPISVTVQVESGHGQMTVHPTSLTVSGVTVSGNTLKFLIDNFLLPRYPGAAVDRPFQLEDNIERILVSATNALVIRK